MAESIKIGGAPKPSKPPKPGEPQAPKGRRGRAPAKGPVGAKEIIILALGALAIVYLILAFTRGWF